MKERADPYVSVPSVRRPATSLKEAAAIALQVQDACNLSGVARDFSIILSEVLWPEATSLGLGTEWVNTHPISRLFTDKMQDLALRGSPSKTDAYAEAYRWAKELTSRSDVS